MPCTGWSVEHSYPKETAKRLRGSYMGREGCLAPKRAPNAAVNYPAQSLASTERVVTA